MRTGFQASTETQRKGQKCIAKYIEMHAAASLMQQKRLNAPSNESFE